VGRGLPAAWPASARKTGAGALRRPVLVALGLRADGKKEIIDFRLAGSERAEWERFPTDLYRRGLFGEGIEMICVDGGSGLLAALPTAFPGIAVQPCSGAMGAHVTPQSPRRLGIRRAWATHAAARPP
jgi:transposase-like protein